MNRFYGWLLTFFFLLFSIPFFLWVGCIALAKVIGVLTVMLLSFSVRFWLYQTRKEYNPKERIRINLNDRFWMKSELAYYRNMNSSERTAFEDRIGILLARVPISYSSGELILDRKCALRVASHVINDLSVFVESAPALPLAIILDSGTWVEQMSSLRATEGVMVLPANLF